MLGGAGLWGYSAQRDRRFTHALRLTLGCSDLEDQGGNGLRPVEHPDRLEDRMPCDRIRLLFEPLEDSLNDGWVRKILNNQQHLAACFG